MKLFSEKKTKLLESLGLYTAEIRSILEKITGKSDWVTYVDNDFSMQVQMVKLKKGRYFAVLSCDALCGLDDKQAFIKDAVEFAIKQTKLPITFKEIGVGGVVADEGRMGFISKLMGNVPPAVHAYAAFKMPGETFVYVEDPRTGIFDTTEKLQSRTDNQVCSFAASAIFYTCAQALNKGEMKKSTPELFSEVYNSTELREYIQSLEKKVGRSRETKEYVIKTFIQQLCRPENPLFQLKRKENVVNDDLSLNVMGPC